MTPIEIHDPEPGKERRITVDLGPVPMAKEKTPTKSWNKIPFAVILPIIGMLAALVAYIFVPKTMFAVLDTSFKIHEADQVKTENKTNDRFEKLETAITITNDNVIRIGERLNVRDLKRNRREDR